MADAPEAPVTPEVKSEATPNTNPEPAPAPEQKPEAPDMHGFTSEQLAEMKKFYDANGGFDKVKAKISNPEPKPAESTPEVKPAEPTFEPTSQPTPPVKPQGRTNEEIMAEFYFEKLSQKPEYSTISGYIANGDVLTEMHKLGIPFRFADGSWDDGRINEFLKIKAQTVPAQPTASEPNASTAPTVNYIDVGEKIENMEQAQAVFMQAGHPRRQDAMDFIRRQINPSQAENK